MDESLSAENLRALRELLAQVIARYGSLDAFFAQIYRLLDYPTTELPALHADPVAGGRHRLRDAC
ncbi:hypothetical protein [Nocardia sp. NBC_01327]|uniref:hypothetical protein n=1 Tax=Nocardia sp. NBC_01327 TaxID=2903593 RepID=UPI002E112E6A|nr:hypothetical protein OG326_21610 [Nocardia sp. NBC_01327]